MNTRPLFYPHFRNASNSLDSTLRQAIETLNKSGLLIVCVVDEDMRLLGIITDSDIRRAILRHQNLDLPLESVMNRQPFTCHVESSGSELRGMVESSGKREIPMLDSQGKLADIFIFGIWDRRVDQDGGIARSLESGPGLSNTMFILAGGLGTRLRSVVSDRPKPLALIGDTPILEHILRHAAKCGLRKFVLSLNYLGEMIEEFLSQERFSSLDISFVREEKRLGTAGSIGYISERVEEPLLVSNADLLTNVPFDRLLAHHKSSASDVTCVVRSHTLNVPYGVVEVAGDQIVDLKEKPSVSFVINAGIYVLSPHVCKLVGKGDYLDMPELLKTCLSKGMKLSAFMLHEYWLDVGKPEDYHKANEDVLNNFKDRSRES